MTKEMSIRPSLIFAAALATLSGCAGSNDESGTTAPVAVAQPLVCDDGIKTAFKPDANTSVLLVRAFKKGDALSLDAVPAAGVPTAQNDMCLVKLNVGPGNAGPAGAPSTSPGIGIEVWLPAAANWNGRVHVYGGGGWAGGVHGRTDAIASAVAGEDNPAYAAGVESAVSAATDTGHAIGNGSFAMNPDGTVNRVLWKDFAERAIHEMALKSKALARAYYGKDARYSYWDGFSTGGRQALKEAQVNPADFDGILAGAPAINWTRFITGELYPQVVMQRDLAGSLLTTAQLQAVSAAAISACDVVGGVHLGYVPDPLQCRYDPTEDRSVLCAAAGGTNNTEGCVSAVQARAINKIWYGQTSDGSVPSPAADAGTGITLGAKQRWYGPTRGTDLGRLAGATPFTIASDLVALELQNAAYATSAFVNATSNGRDQWKSLTYDELANASDRGISLQEAFGGINTDRTDLSALRDRQGKLLMYHGLADQLIPPQGTIRYYHAVADTMGGLPAIGAFSRLYLIPGMGHSFASGVAVPAAPPLPTRRQLYSLLTDWVEKGSAPGRIEATGGGSDGKASRPLCPYPQQAAYTNGDPMTTGSYVCR
jgi:feruloyl esterase